MVLAICLLYAPVAGVLACSQQNSSSILIFCTMGFAPLCGNASHPEKACHPILSSCDLFLTPWMQLNMLWSVFPPDLTQWKSLLLSCFGPDLANLSTTWPCEGLVDGAGWIVLMSRFSVCRLREGRVIGKWCSYLLENPDLTWVFSRLSGNSLFGRVGSQSQAGANGFEGGPSSPEDHQHSPLVVKAVEKRKRKQDTVGSQSESAESFVFSSEEEVEQFEQKEEAAASSSHAVPAKSASRPVQRRSEAIKAEAILGVLFSFPRLFELGGRLVGLPFATCIWTSMAQVTLVERNAFASLCAATHIRNGFSYGSDGYWPGWMMKLGRSTGHAFPPCSNGRQRHGGFRRRLNRGRAGHTAWSVVKEGIKRACP